MHRSEKHKIQINHYEYSWLILQTLPARARESHCGLINIFVFVGKGSV